MKRLLGFLILTLTLMLSTPTFACYTWADYGYFKMGYWGDDSRTINVGNVTGGRYYNAPSWYHGYQYSYAQCRSLANNAFLKSRVMWPEPEDVSQARQYFENLKIRCQNYFTSIYNQYKNSFC